METNFNSKQSLQNNIDAIKTIFLLDKENRKPTSTEKEILSKYCGFGSLKDVTKDQNDKNEWNTAESQKLFLLIKELYAVIKNNTTEQECTDYCRSIRNSTLTAFYTPDEVVNSIASSIKNTGLQFNTIIDPSAGNGIFAEKFKNHFPNIEVTNFEKDLLTGKLLKYLKPDDNTHIKGFEEVENQFNDYYDIISSNIPFGDFKVSDGQYKNSKEPIKQNALQRIHNYFFIKGIDTVREGGLLAFITSRGVLDSKGNEEVRKWLMQNTNLISAIRLPNNLFDTTTNIKVGSDLIILQKNTNKKELTQDEKNFIETKQRKSGAYFNCYFKNMDNIVHTSWIDKPDYRGNPNISFLYNKPLTDLSLKISSILEKDFKNNLNIELFNKNALKRQDTISKEQAIKEIQSIFKDGIIKKIPEKETVIPVPSKEIPKNTTSLYDLYELASNEPTKEIKPQPKFFEWTGDIKEYYRDNSLVTDDKGRAGYLNLPVSSNQKPTFTPANFTISDTEKSKLYIQIRDTYEALYKFEIDNKQEEPKLRENLNSYYDTFVEKFGHLKDRKNIQFFNKEPNYNSICSIENEIDKKFIKSDIFYRPVTFTSTIEKGTFTASDALLSSLNTYGYVNEAYIESLTNKNFKEIYSELKDRIFFNPDSNRFETADKYISGNVVEKIESLKVYLNLDPNNEFLNDSYNALQAAKPQEITFEQLDFNMGERWIPTSIYENYAKHLFYNSINIIYNKNLDDFSVNNSNQYMPLHPTILNEYAVQTSSRLYDGLTLFHHALLNTVPNITKTIRVDGKDIKVPDRENILLANSKIENIRNGFSEWLSQQPSDVKDNLVKIYNRKYNCYVKPKFDGSHQEFPGLTFDKFTYKELYKSQKDAIWGILQNGGGIIDHEVGGGKTLIMCTAAHEMSRLKIAQKPLIIAMKANVNEIAKTYKEAFPNAKLLYPKKADYTEENRIKFFNKIKNNNWDTIILSHEQFKMLPQSLDVQKRIINQELNSVEENLNVLKNDGIKITNSLRKGLEKKIENLTVKLKDIQQSIRSKTDDFIDFKDMGIEHVFVDESHIFKNLMFNTRHKRVAGLGNTDGSERSLNLLMAIRTIQEKTSKDLGATFLSGTTISNSLSELYSIFKYLRPKELEKQDINCFDAWAAIYAKKTTDYEISITNEIVPKERFRYFVKVPELAMFYSEITDFKTGDSIGLDRPKSNEILVSIEPTAEQIDFNKKLIDFLSTGNPDVLEIKFGKKDFKKEAKTLFAINYSKKMALDMRLIDSKYGDNINNKASICAKRINDYYTKFNEQKGTQFVFSDLGVYNPENKGEFNIYSEIKRKLIEDYNIPANEIEFIQKAKTEKAKEAIIKKMNKGEIRVLFGSTQMLGTGVNAQERAVAVHNIDIPWRPSDLEQRQGRAVRTKNFVAKQFNNNSVDVLTYATKNTLDIFRFGLLNNKQNVILQLKNGTIGLRRIDEGSIDEQTGMNLSEFVAILTGNNLLLEKSKLEKQISVLESEKHVFYKDKRLTEYHLNDSLKDLESNEISLKKLQADSKNFQDTVKLDNEGNKINMLKLTDLNSTDIKVINEKLQQINIKTDTNGQHQKIGEIYGFDITVKTEKNLENEKSNKFYVKGELYYTHYHGFLAKDPKTVTDSFMKALESISRTTESYLNKNVELRKKILSYKEILNKEWQNEPLLKKLKTELDNKERELQIALNEKKEEKIQLQNQKPEDTSKQNNIQVSSISMQSKRKFSMSM